MGSYKPVKEKHVDMKHGRQEQLKNSRNKRRSRWIRKREEELKEKAQAHNLEEIIDVDQKKGFVSYNRLKNIERRCS